ncbi:MAG: DNA repair protein [Pseudomonadota bacterium]
MHPQAADILDRLALTPRRGKAAPRLAFGLKSLDTRLEGGLIQGALHEIRAPTARDIGAATGVTLGLLATAAAQSGRDRVMWISDPAAGVDAGVLYPDGIAQYGLDPSCITLVTPVDLQTALWAADEAARCPDLVAVVLHVRGNPRQLDRVATRRLMLRAQTSGCTVLVLRQSGVEEASAAHTRWRVEARPSPPDPGFPQGLGLPQMALTLERSRTGQTGGWPVIWNPKHKAFAHGSKHIYTDPQVSVDRPAVSGHRPDRAAPLGHVVDLRRASTRRAPDDCGADGQECPTDRGA